MSVTFRVDDVAAVRERLPAAPWSIAAKQVLGVSAQVLSDGPRLVPALKTHPLVSAIKQAYAEHRPLRIRPDDIWLTICQGVAIHIAQNAEALRSRIVRQEGKKEVEVVVVDEDYSHIIPSFTRAIADHTGAGLANLFLCDFSTSTPADRIASQVVFLSAMEPFFIYRLGIICGIPEITIEGTIDDWRSILKRLDVVEEFDLGWWSCRLRPMIKHFIRAVEGNPDREFWRRIYIPEKAYGVAEEVCCGWLAHLFPYLDLGNDAFKRNPALVQDLAERIWESTNAGANEKVNSDGIDIERIPRSLSRARVLRRDHAGADLPPVHVVGGFFGVTQADDGTLSPVIGWGVVPESDDEALLRRFAGVLVPGVEKAPLATEAPFFDRLKSLVAGRTAFENTSTNLYGSWKFLPDAPDEWWAFGAAETMYVANHGVFDHAFAFADTNVGALCLWPNPPGGYGDCAVMLAPAPHLRRRDQVEGTKEIEAHRVKVLSLAIRPFLDATIQAGGCPVISRRLPVATMQDLIDVGESEGFF